jgi:hypothetical protein
MTPTTTGPSTPAIEQAKRGILPLDILTTIMPVNDARFVKFSDDQSIPVEPDLSYVDTLQFSTLEQVQSICALIINKYPNSVLHIVDNAGFFLFPGYRKLVYDPSNTGAMHDQRVYKVVGVIDLPEGLTPTEFNVGWLINVKRILNGGSSAMETGPGWPEGITALRAMNAMGLAQPIWVGGDKQ